MPLINLALHVYGVHNVVKSPSLHHAQQLWCLVPWSQPSAWRGHVASAGGCREGTCPRPNTDQQERRWKEEVVKHLRGSSNSQNHPLL